MSKRVVIWTIAVVSLGAIAALTADLLHDHRLASELYSEMKKGDPVVVDQDPVPFRSPRTDPLAGPEKPSGLLILAGIIKSAAATDAIVDDTVDDTVETPPAAAPELSLQEILVKLAEQGYTEILEVEWEHGRYEAKATDADGVLAEVYIDAATGEVMSQKHTGAMSQGHDKWKGEKHGKSSKAKRSTLKFKVTREFRREFKDFAESEGMTVKELLEEGFRLVKERRGM